MKRNYITLSLAMAACGLALTSCDDFLNRPGEDNYNVDIFYQNDAQLLQTANTLYNSPWFDFQRGYFKVGEVMSGNYYWSTSAYLDFTTNSTDEDLNNMSASLWSVNAYCNTLIKNVTEKAAAACTQETINTVKGEALVWKAFTYFYLVRSWGGVPIIHENSSIIASNTYNDLYRSSPKSVYEYIIMTLEKAIEWLPEKNAAGRIDKSGAKALLAKVYLTRAGLSGSLNKEDLQKAVEYAKDVKDNSGRVLMEKYSDIFRLKNNNCSESLIAWRWTAEGTNWTRQNAMQPDLAPQGFDETAELWGGWNGPSVDLIKAFNEDPLKQERQYSDDRRQATLMMAGDVYDYFWIDRSATFAKGGFEILDFFYNTDAATLAKRANLTGGGQFQSPTGAQCVKHLVGDNADHVAGVGYGLDRMASSLSTHLVRLADVYLVLAEAQCLLDGGTTANADALDAFSKVHLRSVKLDSPATSITWEQIWKERRLELANEGDRWFDFVRLSYYDADRAIAELKGQDRGTYYGLDEVYKPYFEGGYKTWTLDERKTGYSPAKDISVNKSHFTLPFPAVDLAMNPHLSEEPVDTDISQFGY